MTIRKGTIQIGKLTLEAEIDMEDEPVTDDQIDAMRGAFAWIGRMQRQTWKTPVYHFRPITDMATVVDGSLAQPMTDPARLLPEKSAV